MSTLRVADVRSLGNADALRELCAALRALGFSLKRLAARTSLGATPKDLLTRSQWYSLLYADELAASEDPFDVTAALLWFNRRLLLEEFRRLPADLRTVLRELGLVVLDRDAIRPMVTIVELDGIIVLADPPFENRGGGKLELMSSHAAVMPLHASSLELLERVMHRATSSSLLDIGCGAGSLALLLADHYPDVEGIDVNPRAIEFARANAVLNDKAVMFRIADISSFTSTRRFCSAVFNAPCALSYDGREGRGGVSLEELAAMIARAAATILADGGSLQVHCIVPVPRSAASAESVVRDLLSALPCVDVQVDTISPSPFELTAQSIARGHIPRTSYLLASPDDGPLLAKELRRNAVSTVNPVVVTVQRK